MQKLSANHQPTVKCFLGANLVLTLVHVKLPALRIYQKKKKKDISINVNTHNALFFYTPCFKPHLHKVLRE